jgi:hypothetical protein
LQQSVQKELTFAVTKATAPFLSEQSALEREVATLKEQVTAKQQEANELQEQMSRIANANQQLIQASDESKRKLFDLQMKIDTDPSQHTKILHMIQNPTSDFISNPIKTEATNISSTSTSTSNVSTPSSPTTLLQQQGDQKQGDQKQCDTGTASLANTAQLKDLEQQIETLNHTNLKLVRTKGVCSNQTLSNHQHVLLIGLHIVCVCVCARHRFSYQRLRKFASLCNYSWVTRSICSTRKCMHSHPPPHSTFVPTQYRDH